MRKHSRVVIGTTLIAAAACVLAACSSSGGGKGTQTPSSGGSSNTGGGAQGVKPAFNAAVNAVVNPSTKSGGTLKLLTDTDADSWDPQRAYYGWVWNMQRLYVRSLIGYSKVNGDKFTLAPDLATDMGTHDATFTNWTYTLKPGLKFSNGQPITPKDVKYGIERLFATDVINGGPASYFIQGIAHPKNYLGPYKSGDLDTITTTDTTISFKLSGPNADFNYLMAMGASSPVPAKTEGGPGFVGATYTKHPVSSGPYMVESYQPAKQITFVRNPNWSQESDTIHHPLVDKVVLTVDTSDEDIDSKLAAGEADARAEINVGAAFQTKIVTQPDLKKNADDPTTPFTRYMAVMQSVIPNVHCRRAIFYAFDKAAFVQAYGGTYGGVPAASMTPPGIPGADPTFNPYPSGADNHGDVAKAKDELQQCGQPNGFSTKYAYATPGARAADAFKAEQSALARVGIKVTPTTADASSYYNTFIGSPRHVKSAGIGIAFAAWGADFPTIVGFYQSIANGNAIVDPGTSNYASLDDPTVNGVLDKAPAGKATEDDFKNLDKALMTAAVYLPALWGKSLYYRNPRLTNVTCDTALAFGIYDFVNVGVNG
jgi:peptide/nickel transport system substrate-binding protein